MLEDATKRFFMPCTVSLHRVFLASPGDVDEERSIVSNVIMELNKTIASAQGIVLELIRWETDTFPNFGTDAQDVINSQIEQNYDVFIGILWSRFGTATSRASSGTEEEFLSAFHRWKQNLEAVTIMLYFKDSPIQPSRMDPDQIVKVLAFKKATSAQGGLHHSFNDANDFERALRVHLSGYMKSLASRSLPVEVNATEIATLTETSQENEADKELGYFEHLQRFENSMEILNQFAKDLSEFLVFFSLRIQARTKEVGEIASLRKLTGKLDTKSSLTSSNKTADDLLNFGKSLEAHTKVFSEAYKKAIDSFQHVYSISKDFTRDAPEDTEAAEKAISSLISSIEYAHSECVKLQSTLMSMPRMSSRLNKAKRTSVEALANLLNEFVTFMDLFRMVKEMFSDLQAS